MTKNKSNQKKQTKLPTLQDSTLIKGILQEMGYKLIDCGTSWRTKAIFREGSNPISIQIYKDSGVWIDYAAGGDGRPFEALVQLSVGRHEAKSLLKRINRKGSVNIEPIKRKTLITMDKVYPESCLDSLFPNYYFYKKRKIGETTQKLFKLGMATQGKLYRRIVFPIYSADGQIVGFSGRHVDDHPIKWKHMGKKTKWVYPAFVPNEEQTVDEILNESDEVFLVESIGDCMAMREQGMTTSLVSFGVVVSPALLSYLSSKSFKSIVIVPNNDLKATTNNGLIGGVKNLMKLSKYFNINQLTLRTPPNKHNDMGEAHAAGENFRTWARQGIDREAYVKCITSLIRKNPSLRRDEAGARQFIKLLNA